MHHKSYFEKCLLSSLIVQENPKAFKEVLASQNLKSFPTFMASIDNLTSPDTENHTDFNTLLKKYSLLCKFKLDQDAEGMVSLIEDSDFEWILTDQQVLALFNPTKNDALSSLLIQIFDTHHPVLKDQLDPFVTKTVKVIAELFSDDGKLINQNSEFTFDFEIAIGL